MAKTKFLDYTGLAKLVEKIKNTYVNIGGSTMTGTLKTLENQPAINFRPNNSGYSVTLNYDTESAEALAINLKNFATSFMINSGVDGTTWTGEGHQSKVTPTIHVRKNCVSINKYIADNITQEYKLDVNGDVKANSFTGKLNGNANTASKLGTATVGGATKPMYLSGGTPTECTYTLAQNVTSASKLTDTTYSASTGLSLSKDNKFSINAATSSTIGGVKIGSGITVDTGGTISLTKGNVVNALGYTPPTADTNTTYTFTSGTGGTFTVKASNSDSGQTVSVGVPAKASAATSAETAATAEKVGSETVGSATQPIYLSGGTPTKCTYTLAQSVTSTSKLTDHLYNAGEGLKLTTGTTADTFSLSAATSSTIGGVKIGNNISITSGTISLTKGNVVNALGYTPPTADTNTTYTFTNGTDGTFTVKASNSTKAQTISVGKTASASTADNAVNAQTAETANKLSVNAGSDMTPIYFKDGVPKPCDSTLGVNINGRANYASLADKLPINAGSASVDDVLVIGNYSGGPIHMGGGVGPGEFTPTDIIEKDGDYYLLNVSKANTANSASKLNIGTTGTPTKPVYFNNGVPATCTYELNKTVPSTAIFTDTKYTLSGDGTNKVTITDSNKSSQTITINDVQRATVATYAKKYSYNGMDSDFVYDVVDGGNHYIRCKDAKILRANGTNLNNYEFIINADGKGGCYIYDSANAKGTTWGPDGIVFDKAPANSLVAAKGTFATAISDTDIKNEINSAIDWTQAL